MLIELGREKEGGVFTQTGFTTARGFLGTGAEAVQTDAQQCQGHQGCASGFW